MLLVSAAVAVVAGGADTPSSAEAAHARLQGEGSSWAAQMIDAARVDASRLGLTIDYSASGSTAGRRSFLRGTTDFAVSDVPFQFEPEDGSLAERPSAGTYTYLPATAGGTAFVYNLDIDGQPVTNLRLSGDTVARIFTGLVDRWDDPAIAADNPRLALPDLPLTPVVRSDGAGSTAHLTTWLAARHGDHWKDYCTRTARAPDCVPTSYFPAVG
ncbi:MAG: substrate-binding domain-containing protein, partial [Acidimicrobiia bacterium]